MMRWRDIRPREVALAVAIVAAAVLSILEGSGIIHAVTATDPRIGRSWWPAAKTYTDDRAAEVAQDSLVNDKRVYVLAEIESLAANTWLFGDTSSTGRGLKPDRPITITRLWLQGTFIDGADSALAVLYDDANTEIARTDTLTGTTAKASVRSNLSATAATLRVDDTEAISVLVKVDPSGDGTVSGSPKWWTVGVEGKVIHE